VKNKNEKQKSFIIKDALALFIITLVSSLVLSLVYEITKDPIKRQEEQKKMEAYQAVYGGAALLEEDEGLNKRAEEIKLTALHDSYENTTIDEVNQALDSSGNLMGYIIKVSTKGYQDTITLAIGYSLDGVVQGMEIMDINDTAGLGMNAKKPEFKNQFKNKTVEKFEVTKTGAVEDYQINAISSATITSKAVVKAVNAGIGFLTEYAVGFGGGADE
jgi:electron transport complex protein RnfG